MTTHYGKALLATLAFFNFFGQLAFAAPSASTKTFAGTYTFSSFANTTTGLKTVDRSYQGMIKISPAGKLSGRLTKTVSSFTSGSDDFSSKESSVTVSGKITKVRKSTHAGYKVLEALTTIKFSDGAKGTLSILYPYTVKPPQISGSGTIISKRIKFGTSLQRM